MTAVASPAVEDRPYHLFTAEYESLRASVRDLLTKRLASRADEIDRSGLFPRDLLKELGDLGYLGLAFPEDVGGSGDPVAAAVVAEELGRTGVYGFAAAVLHHLSAALAVALGGTESQRARLAPALAGDELWALATGEPHLDPDPAQTRAAARPTDGGYALSGAKAFVPNAAAADALVVTARIGERLAAFLVDGDAVRRLEQEVMAWWPCPVGEVLLDGVAVGQDACLVGDVTLLLSQVHRWQALSEALALTGLAARAVEAGMAYGLDRQAFGRPVAKFQVWRHRWADAQTAVEAARAVAIQALRLVVHGEPADRIVASARLYCGRVAFECADECVQMHGGYGYMMEYPAQRFWRDARQATVVAGGDHVWLETISHELGL